jgi:signal peptide peptidase SppA
MIELRHVAARFYNRPLLLTPSSAETISAVLFARVKGGAAAAPGAGAGLGGVEHDAGSSVHAFAPTEKPDGSAEFHSARASRFYGEYAKDDQGRPTPYRRTADGTAILTLVGEWVNRGAWVGASSGLISYEGFSYQMRRAADDSDVRAILLDIESPGGEAVGAFEAAAVVRAVAAVKPVTAFVNGMAASAAYAIASGASRIVTIPTGLSGSIGVVLMHLDFSKWLEDEGIKPTLIFAGDRKVDGNPFEPLPKNVRAELQAEVAGFYGQFVETVAAGRGLSSEKVIATQARVFKGDEAVAAGLADAVGTFESVLSEMQTARTGRTTGVHMNDKTGAAAAANAAINQADHDSAIEKATASAAGAAKTRINTILSAKEAAGRGLLAHHLAFDTDMAADAAIALLGKAPKEAAEKASRLDGAVPQPKLDSGETRLDSETIAARWDAVVAKINKETAAASGRRS